MKLHIITQYMENYGAHDWDGEGECPQYWKMKGGEDYFILNVDSDAEAESAVAQVRGDIEWNDIGSRQYIIGYGLVENDFMTEFEVSQLEYDGRIAYPAKVLEFV
jgi:hypothetical protein